MSEPDLQPMETAPRDSVVTVQWSNAGPLASFWWDGVAHVGGNETRASDPCWMPVTMRSDAGEPLGWAADAEPGKKTGGSKP